MQNFDQEQLDFINDFSEMVSSGQASIFIGAGLSLRAGLPSWLNLLTPALRRLKLDKNEIDDLSLAAQFYINSYGKQDLKDKISNAIQNASWVDKGLTIFDTIASLPISSIWTTNFDGLIENSLRLKRNNNQYEIKIQNDQIGFNLSTRNLILYKMHGCATSPSTIILSSEEFENYKNTHSNFIISLQYEMLHKQFLFLGFSFRDRNIINIISNLTHRRKHFVIFKKSDSNYQTYFEKNLLNLYNLQSVYINDYSEIDCLLNEISNRIRNKEVFISANSTRYRKGIFKEAKNVEIFLSLLGEKIVSLNKKLLITGRSKTSRKIAEGVISGCIKHNKNVDSFLSVRPLSTQNSKYDDNKNIMLDRAGFKIFLFGATLEEKNRSIIDQSGIYKIFQQSVNNSKVIPVGFTGGITEKLWEEASDNFEKYYHHADMITLRESFDRLGPNEVVSSIDDAIDRIINFIEILQS